jgi:hypothetical protein
VGADVSGGLGVEVGDAVAVVVSVLNRVTSVAVTASGVSSSALVGLGAEAASGAHPSKSNIKPVTIKLFCKKPIRDFIIILLPHLPMANLPTGPPCLFTL